MGIDIDPLSSSRVSCLLHCVATSQSWGKRLAVRLIVLLAFASLPYPGPALAVSVIVPEDYGDVQTAVDSGADSIVVREGSYPERVVIDRSLVLRGVGGARPRLDGLIVYNSNFLTPRELSVTGIDFTGGVYYQTLYVHPRGLRLSFTECRIDSGLQIANLDSYDIGWLSLRHCRLGVHSDGQADDVFMEADTIDGGVAWRVEWARVQDCWFRGGPGRALELTGYPKGGPVARNRFETYRTGIYMENSEGYPLDDNTIVRCERGIELRGLSEAVVTNNVSLECRVGVDIASCDGLWLLENTIWGAGTGALLFGVSGNGGLTVEHNVIGGCKGDGIAVSSFRAPEVNRIRCNTIVENGGSAVRLTQTADYPIEIAGNIAFRNGGWGLTAPVGARTTLGCNDWFGNGLGAVDGVARGATDKDVDPMFCDVNSGDLRLDVSSPLIGDPVCGQIGALSVGCGVTATRVQRFSATRVSQGVRVFWEVAEGATASEIWLERSGAEEGQEWTRPLMERSNENGAVAELDRSAERERAYWYRLMALEGGEVRVIGAPIGIEAEPRLEFRLLEIGPNPGNGPLRIAFALRQSAVIGIDIFDVQGRSVASPGRGSWPAGPHEVMWDGQARNGEPAPAGMYVVRYAYPGGQDRRTVVRVN